MNRPLVPLATMVVAASLLLAGCSQAAPLPTPTLVAAAPTRAAEPTRPAAEPTRPPAPQPTSAPVKKTTFPEKGRSISLIVPFSPGGVDTSARVFAPALEKELGVAVQVVNKAGGGSQVGTTEVALARPDGYTLLYTALEAAITSYLDPERKAAYSRKSFDPVALATVDPTGYVVGSASPFKSLKELVDAAKANPEKVKMAAGALMSGNHLAVLMFEKLSGVSFANVHFDGGAQSMTALLGGHVDVAMGVTSTVLPHVKSGAMRVLALADSEESEFLPGVKTAESQGYKIYIGTSSVIAAPAGTPREVVDLLGEATRKALASDEVKNRLRGVGVNSRYLSPTQFGAFWEKMEADIQPLVLAAAQKK